LDTLPPAVDVNPGQEMKQGYLSQYFDGVAAKELTAVEADLNRSNGHEYNATKAMLDFMGRPSEATRLATRFVYVTDEDPEPVTEDASLTLYDARKNKTHRAAEYRFYFQTTQVSINAAEGDLLVLGKLHSGQILAIVAEKGSSIASQLLWLFGFSSLKHNGFAVRGRLDEEKDRVGFAARIVLEQIGVEIIEKGAEDFLTEMLTTFGRAFPITKVFSAYARSTLPEVVATDDPDAALMAWMEREELLFRSFEREIVSARLNQGFAGDVDGFMQFSLSVHNRRKSRAGFALEHHLSTIFDDCRVKYSKSVFTEKKSKPDFLFPGIVDYRRADFPVNKLTMLGAKTTCKDRWRQVLAEAKKVKTKHILTLEAAISSNQTDEMKAKHLQLVLPRQLHQTYSPAQRKWLMNLRAFIGLVTVRQS
jgi:hypothetical protein